MRPLEERFPTLYHDIVHESAASGEKPGITEKRTPKAEPPTLLDVIEAVCSVHRVSDRTFMKDLASTVTEFLKQPSEESNQAKKAKKAN